jgi:branched-chain amino acid transport system ATP-binding protein
MNETDGILELRGIHSFYGSSHVLHGISLSVKKGFVTSVLGRNGVGKTTLLNTIIGEVSPREGIIEFKGKPISSLPSYKVARMGIGLVPQGRRIFRSLTVEENLLIVTRKERRRLQKMEELYALFPSLEERRYHRGKELSGGEQQMLAIARALMSMPELLLLDEPFEGVAPILVQNIRSVLKKLKEEIAISMLLTSPNLKLMLDLCDRSFILSKGQLVWESSVDELEANKDIQLEYLGVGKARSS